MTKVKTVRYVFRRTTVYPQPCENLAVYLPSQMKRRLNTLARRLGLEFRSPVVRFILDEGLRRASKNPKSFRASFVKFQEQQRKLCEIADAKRRQKEMS